MGRARFTTASARDAYTPVCSVRCAAATQHAFHASMSSLVHARRIINRRKEPTGRPRPRPCRTTRPRRPRRCTLRRATARRRSGARGWRQRTLSARSRRPSAPRFVCRHPIAQLPTRRCYASTLRSRSRWARRWSGRRRGRRARWRIGPRPRSRPRPSSARCLRAHRPCAHTARAPPPPPPPTGVALPCRCASSPQCSAARGTLSCTPARAYPPPPPSPTTAAPTARGPLTRRREIPAEIGSRRRRSNLGQAPLAPTSRRRDLTTTSPAQGEHNLSAASRASASGVKFAEKSPTAAHMGLVALVGAGYVSHVVSQNVDGLHLRRHLGNISAISRRVSSRQHHPIAISA